MSYDAFKNLELIPQLLDKVSLLEDKIKLLEINLIKNPDLTKRKNVIEYLGISESSLNNYMKDGRLKRGVHYTKSIENGKVKITYISEAIKKLVS